MPKKSKNSKNDDFKKVKLKPGKILKKTNVTDTRMAVKKVILLEQLKEKTSSITTFRGLTLEDLCRQLGHYRQNVKRDALIGVYQLLSNHSELLYQYLRLIMPAVARLIGDETNDNKTRVHLKNLLEMMCSTPEVLMESHFSLLIINLLCGLTHMQLSIRLFALKITVLVMKNYRTLCLKNMDLFDGFLNFIASPQCPNDKELIIRSWKYFLNVYFGENTLSERNFAANNISFSNKTSDVDLSNHFSSMDYYILYSPFKTQEFIINCDLTGEISSYIHRIGCTRRLRQGIANTFFDPNNPRDVNLASKLVEIIIENGREAPEFLLNVFNPSFSSFD